MVVTFSYLAWWRVILGYITKPILLIAYAFLFAKSYCIAFIFLWCDPAEIVGNINNIFIRHKLV